MYLNLNLKQIKKFLIHLQRVIDHFSFDFKEISNYLNYLNNLNKPANFNCVIIIIIIITIITIITIIAIIIINLYLRRNRDNIISELKSCSIIRI